MNDHLETFYRLTKAAFEKKQISQSSFDYLMDRFTEDLDELEQCFRDLIHAIEHGEYYITLDRIAKGEEKLASETDESKKSEYRKLLNELTIKLESLTPKGESA